jgi:hypothetical protein
MIQYTAKRSLVLGHVAGQSYTLDLEISEAVPNVVDVREDARSAGGAIESTFERQDVYWAIDTAPFCGHQVGLVREFLDSIESGEAFRVWLSDRDIVPLLLKQEGEAGTEESFMRTGSAEKDVFTARFSALQAAPYDITGLQPGGSDGGFDGGDSEPIDVYDPEDGTGGLDEPEGEEVPTRQIVIQVGTASGDTTRGFSSFSGFGSVISSDWAGVDLYIAQIRTTEDILAISLNHEILLEELPPSEADQLFSSVTVEGIGTFNPDLATFEPGSSVSTWTWSLGDAAPYFSSWTIGSEQTLAFAEP